MKGLWRIVFLFQGIWVSSVIGIRFWKQTIDTLRWELASYLKILRISTVIPIFREGKGVGGVEGSLGALSIRGTYGSSKRTSRGAYSLGARVGSASGSLG